MRKNITASDKRICKQIFLQLCLDKQACDYINNLPISIISKNKRNIYIRWYFRKNHYNLSKISVKNLNFWTIDNKCRYCKQLIDNESKELTYSYWSNCFKQGPIWYICHKNCQKDGYKDEVYECQKIDANCNDCTFFERKKICIGWCMKYQKEVISSNDLFQGNDCFIHRKDLKENA